MKRILAILAFVFLAFVFVACGNSATDSGAFNLGVYDIEGEEVFKGEIKFTEEDSLEQLLKDHKDIKMKGEESSFGFFVVEMKGINANDYENAFWNIKVDGEDSLVGISEIKLIDGSKIEFYLITWN